MLFRSQLGVRTVERRVPFAARLDYVINPQAVPAPSPFPGHRNSTTAFLSRVAVGDVHARDRVEASYTFEVVDPDAVVGAYTSDDWWYHSAAVGHCVSVAGGVGHGVVARLSGYLQRRSDSAMWSERVLLDVTWEMSE